MLPPASLQQLHPRRILAILARLREKFHIPIKIALTLHRPAAPRHEQPGALADLLYIPVPPRTGVSRTLRLHETLGRRGTASLRFATGLRAEASDLLYCALPDVFDAPSATLSFRSFQTISLRIAPAATAAA